MNFKMIPIPNLDEQRRKALKTYSIKINIQRKNFNEQLVDVRTIGISGENYYYKTNNPPYYDRIKGSIEELYLRKSVAEKLVKINEKLKKQGVEIYIYDCYRPVEVQYFLSENWYPKYLRRLYPQMSHNDIYKMRDKYAAKGYRSFDEINKEFPPPHSTGAATDLTLRLLKSKELLFMGSIFDDIAEVVHTDYFENLQKHKILSLSEEEAQKNRRLLYWAMKEEGVENYPDEWWHFSSGDQLWAALSENDEAYYSSVQIPNNC